MLINAGPTYEPIDPVRFIGNHSTGKMGVALAEEAHKLGAEVKLILGPNSVLPKTTAIAITRISTALEMQAACEAEFGDADIAILAAAIADYRPANPVTEKIKKAGSPLKIELVENPDILAGLGKAKSENQVLVGFALETNNGLENAVAKLHKKNCDLIVLNTPTAVSGFGSDTNEVTLIDRKENKIKLELKSKAHIAQEILHHIIHNLSV